MTLQRAYRQRLRTLRNLSPISLGLTIGAIQTKLLLMYKQNQEFWTTPAKDGELSKQEEFVMLERTLAYCEKKYSF